MSRGPAMNKPAFIPDSTTHIRIARFCRRSFGVLSAASLLAGLGCKTLPQQAAVYDMRFLDQGWTVAQRQAYYHTPQGVQILPYEWFLALEQLKSTNAFLDNDHVSRYRLLPDPNPLNNLDRLPVGVVKDVDDETKKAYFGLTCAACHTGQINYRGMGLRIEGGEGTLDLVTFVEAMFKSLALTYVDPGKFDRFARRALGDRYSAAAKSELRAEVKQKLREEFVTVWKGAKRHLYPTPDGFGRQDALGHGGNIGFSKIGIDSNLRVADGPVSFPAVWQALNWDWVQYNGSIRQPMGRNVGEVLGVGGWAVLKGRKEDLYKSSVKILNLHALEEQIRTLQPPRWPEDILGLIDTKKAARGAALYEKRCAGCHEAKIDPTNGDYLIKLFPLERIGTDPKQAVNLASHKIDTGDLGYGIIPAGTALQHITENVAQRKYKELGISTEEQAKMNRGKTNLWAANLSYRAHTLHGIWATPPYLHNGSVPNLYELLSPIEERSKQFYTGNLEFDPVLVGYEKGKFEGGFLFRTDLPGNSNAGHEFRDSQPGKGVIGTRLTPSERMELIEHLKTK